jgi:hypothetical protein
MERVPRQKYKREKRGRESFIDNFMPVSVQDSPCHAVLVSQPAILPTMS